MIRLICGSFAVGMTFINWLFAGSLSLALWMTVADYALFFIMGIGVLAIDLYQQERQVRRAAEDAARFLSGEWRE